MDHLKHLLRVPQNENERKRWKDILRIALKKKLIVFIWEMLKTPMSEVNRNLALKLITIIQ